jgi:hypothetical protein
MPIKNYIFNIWYASGKTAHRYFALLIIGLNRLPNRLAVLTRDSLARCIPPLFEHN